MDVARSHFLSPPRPFTLRPGLIRDLQKIAVEGIVNQPGEWRRSTVQITKSRHQPPEPHLVEALVIEFCDYINNNWHERTPLHLAVYAMWRLNWINPFLDGNGRTSRTLSYLILTMKLGYELPGDPTIVKQIQDDRTRYFRALESADGASAEGRIDVSEMEMALKGH